MPVSSRKTAESGAFKRERRFRIIREEGGYLVCCSRPDFNAVLHEEEMAVGGFKYFEIMPLIGVTGVWEANDAGYT